MIFAMIFDCSTVINKILDPSTSLVSNISSTLYNNAALTSSDLKSSAAFRLSVF